MKQLVALILIFTIFGGAAQTAAAQNKGDWAAVENLIGQEIAVETTGGRKVFGILRAAGDDELRMRIAEKKSIAATETAFARNEIAKVWRAVLRFGGRQTGKGALYGAGAGAAIGTAIFLGSRSRDDDGLAGAMIPLGMVYGAGAGAVIGFFGRKKHRTKELVYSFK